MGDAPERIWLNDDGDHDAAQGRDDEEGGVTWCIHRVDDDDTGFIRADLYDALSAENERLRGATGLLLAEVESMRDDTFHCCTVNLDLATLKGDDKIEVERLDEMIAAARAALKAARGEPADIAEKDA